MTLLEPIEKLKFSDVIAILALIVSGISIFWNIYRDILLKARLKVRVQISKIVQPGSPQRNTFIDITATNHGPGAITCESILARRRSLFRWLKPNYLFIVPDYTNPLSTQLPKKLEVGEKLTLFLPYREKTVLAPRPTHLGIQDSFGRVHWADRDSLKEAIVTYLKNFPEEKWKNKSKRKQTNTVE